MENGGGQRRPVSTGAIGTVPTAVVCAVAVGLVAVVVLGGFVVADAAATEPSSAGYQLAEEQPDADNTITRIDLAADGSATWRITFRTRLATDEELEEYERFQASFENDTARYLDPFEERMTGVVDGANDGSDREMAASDFHTSTSIQEVPRRWGVVTFRFTWDGFAALEDNRVVVGDVFESGFYIGAGDALEVAAPEGFVIESAEPTPDETGATVVEWRGREDFTDGRPRVVAAPEGDGETPLDDNGEELDGETDRSVPFSSYLIPFVLLVSVGAVAAYAVRRERGSNASTSGSPSDHAGVASENDGSGTDDTRTEADGRAADPSDGENSSVTRGESGLLTDEDRVERLLREEGGRMRQTDIVETLDWSKSKGSRVLSKMADEGAIEKLRIGRENVIDLEDDD